MLPFVVGSSSSCFPRKGLGGSELLINPFPCIGLGIDIGAIISRVLMTPHGSSTGAVTAIALCKNTLLIQAKKERIERTNFHPSIGPGQLETGVQYANHSLVNANKQSYHCRLDII